jgi:DNA-binding GntR family transcriptional regulator
MKKRENLKEKVYQVIKSKVLEFELKPGEKILENKIAKEIGVSRTPIREALNKLEQEGLIGFISNKGYFVSDVSSKEIQELFEVREILEVYAIRAAFEAADADDWSLLEQKLLANETSGDPEDPAKARAGFFKESHHFHEELARICGNRTLQQILNSISDKIYRLNWMNIFFLDRSKQSNQEHIEIVRYLKNGHVDEAINATRVHVSNSKENILKLLEKKKNLMFID